MEPIFITPVLVAPRTFDYTETPSDLTTGKRHETQSHPRSVTYFCITAFHHAISIQKINSTYCTL